MKNYASVDLLETFSEKEIERFSRFITADYFNTNDVLTNLFNALKERVLSNLTFDETARLVVYKIVFPDEKVENAALSKEQRMVLNSRMSELAELLKQFLCIEKMKEKPTYKNELYYECLKEKKQYHLILRQVNKETKALNSIVEKDEDFYNRAYKTAYSKLQYFHDTGLLIKEDNLGELENNLDHFYLLKKLSIHLTAVSMSGYKNKVFDFNPMMATKPLLELPQYNKHPLIQVYQTVITLIQTGKQEDYLELRDLLRKEKTTIPKHKLDDFYSVACNFCATQIRNGKKVFNSNLLELYKQMKEDDLLLEKGIMPLALMKNAVAVASKTGAFEWARKFVEEYKSAILKQYRKDVCRYNYGVILFYEKKYWDALRKFVTMGKVNGIYEVNANIMTLKCYYQLDEDYEEITRRKIRIVSSDIEKLKTISSEQREGFQNFIKIFEELYKYRFEESKKSLDEIRDEFANYKLISDSGWAEEAIHKSSK